MKTSIRFVLIVLVGAIVAAATFAVYILAGLNDEDEPLNKLGGIENFIPAREVKMAPHLEFIGKDGEKLNLENFRGRVVVLNLWATWCGPCVEEMPTLDHLQQQLAPLGVVVVALSLDRDGPTKVQEFFEENEIKHLGVFVDPTMRAQETFNVIGLPTTILIDRDGRERGRIVGPAEWGDAKAADLVLSASTPFK